MAHFVELTSMGTVVAVNVENICYLAAVKNGGTSIVFTGNGPDGSVALLVEQTLEVVMNEIESRNP